MAHGDFGNEKYVLSFGAGLNSTALLIFLINNGHPLDEVVFADTGGEVPDYSFFISNLGSKDLTVSIYPINVVVISFDSVVALNYFFDSLSLKC